MKWLLLAGAAAAIGYMLSNPVPPQPDFVSKQCPDGYMNYGNRCKSLERQADDDMQDMQYRACVLHQKVTGPGSFAIHC